jgi:serine phosphatase RsbU (regulator of sigma subunit)
MTAMQNHQDALVPDLLDLVTHRLAVQATDSLEITHKLFAQCQHDYLAVLDGERVVGLCARQHIGILLGQQFGFSLYARKPVALYMEPAPCIVDRKTSMDEVLKMAFAREGQSFHEDVILTEDGRIQGLIETQTLVRLQTSFLLQSIGDLQAKQAEINEKNGQIQEDLLMAHGIQQAFVARDFEERSGKTPVSFSCRWLSAGNVGGDLCHVFPASDSALGIMLCDVMGHGVQAALVASMLRAICDDLGPLAADPGRALAAVNKAIVHILGATGLDMFATACFAVFDTTTRILSYAVAGHTPPLIIRRARREVEMLQPPIGARGVALGMFPVAEYKTAISALNASDALLLFTDGLYEIDLRNGAALGPPGIANCAHGLMNLRGGALLDKLLAAVRHQSISSEFADDVCVICLDTLLASAPLSAPVKTVTPAAPPATPAERWKMIEFEAYLLAEKNNFKGDSADYWTQGEALVNSKLAY